MQRINRKLSADSQQLKTCRSPRDRSYIGNYFVIDTRLNVVKQTHVDVEELGKELGALRPWEQLAEETADDN
jgi:hypothetical protein